MCTHVNRGFAAALLLAAVVAGQQRIAIRIGQPAIANASKFDPALQAVQSIGGNPVGTTPDGAFVIELPRGTPFDAGLRQLLAAIPGVRAVRRHVGGPTITPIDFYIVHRQRAGGTPGSAAFERRSLREPGALQGFGALAAEPDVAYLEFDYRYTLGAGPAVPPRSAPVEQWALKRIRAPGAWKSVTNSTVRIAVLDSGVDTDHPDLAANLLHGAGGPVGKDFTGSDVGLEDKSGHGTAVTGVIAARGDNGVGIDGVAWSAEVITVKIFGDDSVTASTMDIAEAIRFAIDQGAKIINASWGGPNYSKAVHLAIQEAQAEGVLFVTIAGNGDLYGVGQDLDAPWDPLAETFTFYPAMLPEDNVLTVLATDELDGRAEFSNYGALSIDIAAPGVDIWSTTIDDAPPYDLHSGTSYATPLVAGAAALVWSHLGGPDAVSYADVKKHLVENADPVEVLAGDCIARGVLDIGFLGPVSDTSDSEGGGATPEAGDPGEEKEVPPPDKPSDAGSWAGELEHGVVAIGGETTGTLLHVDGRTLELDVRGVRPRPDLEKLSGKRVRVSGRLIVVKGIERPERSIVQVMRIEPIEKR